MMMVGLAIVFLASVCLVNEVTPFLAMGDHAIDGSPIGQTADITVVDEEVGFEFAGEMGIVVCGFLRVVAVGGIKLHATLATPLKSVVKEFSLTTCPKDKSMAVTNEHFQRLDGKRTLLTNLRIFVLDDGSVEIYCYYHRLFLDRVVILITIMGFGILPVVTVIAIVAIAVFTVAIAAITVTSVLAIAAIAVVIAILAA